MYINKNQTVEISQYANGFITTDRMEMFFTIPTGKYLSPDIVGETFIDGTCMVRQNGVYIIGDGLYRAEILENVDNVEIVAGDGIMHIKFKKESRFANAENNSCCAIDMIMRIKFI